jgi:hypothetical protein
MIRSPRVRAGVLGALAALMVLSSSGAATNADSIAGSQGTDTSLPLTDSAVTVSGRGAWSALSITVNQTKQLRNQAISITWKGAPPTGEGPGRFAQNYLQIFQCWGNDDGSVPSNPGPPPEQCVAGATTATYEGISTPSPNGFAPTRVIFRSSWPGYSPSMGVTDPANGNVYRPFKSVDGTTIGVHLDASFNPSVQGGNFWLNPYFNIITTNELPATVTKADGTGAELMRVDTGLESSGLGCGQKVLSAPDGSKTFPKCWLVVVPRGTPEVENAGTPYAVFGDRLGVFTSALTPAAWANRIAIPLDFEPVDSACKFSSSERRLAGSELATDAIQSWQPALCGDPAREPFSFASISDAAARQQVAASTPGGPSMAVVSRPLDTSQVNPSSPAVYAPLTLSGVVIGFNIERQSSLTAPLEQIALDGVRFAQIKLTPRLVAKLLTQSYTSQLAIASSSPGYSWASQNPGNLSFDKDFIRFNPEFADQFIRDTRMFGGLSLPVGNSDAIREVWRWILADPEAAAWLGGQPDEWGMKVNPYYSTDVSKNPSGIGFGEPVPTNFPKADPYCYQAPTIEGPPVVKPPPLCGTDWRPYNRGLAEGARVVRAGFDSARIVENVLAQASSSYWKTVVPQGIGVRSTMAITDTSSANLYGLQAAMLSRAGDNGLNRQFLAPTTDAMLTSVSAMSTDPESGMLIPDPSNSKPGAYPLALLTYGIIKPLDLTADQRRDFADFVDYASGPGQTVGFDRGNLPLGYVPLPAVLRSQAQAASQLIRTLQPPSSSTATTTTTTVVTATTPVVTTTTTVVDTTTTVVDTTTTVGTTNPNRPTNTTISVTRPRPTTPTTSMAEAETTTTTVVASTTSSTPPSTTAVDSGGPVPSTSVPVPSTSVSVTPGSAVPPGRFAVLAVGVAALASALGALEISKRARRAAVSPETSAL